MDKPDQQQAQKAAKEAKLAKALRANLRRRKGAAPKKTAAPGESRD